MLYLAKLLRGEPQTNSHQQRPLVLVGLQPIGNVVVSSMKTSWLKATLLAIALFATTSAMALPQPSASTTPNTTVPVNLILNSTLNLNPNQNPNQSQPTTALSDDSDSQVAPPPATPFLGSQNDLPTDQALASVTNPMPAATSLAHTMQPSAEALSAANQKLLTQNAQLQRDVNDLSTQVNVLINERSGQLFMYGAITVTISLILGFLLGAFIFSRRDRW